MKSFRVLILAAAVLAPGLGNVVAQSYPTKPIRLIVPYAPGGATDAMARVYAGKFQEAWGQPVVVENRAGAGGNIGAEVVAKAAPDGYTWLLNTSGQAIAPGLYKKLNYDPAKDLAPITQLVTTSLVLVTSAQSPYTSVKDLIGAIKGNPGKFNYGSTGIGSAPHLNGEMFRSSMALDVIHVPYKGDAQVFPALLAGEILYGFIPPQSGLAQIKAGKFRALAVTGSNRQSAMPDVPTMMQSGVTEHEYNGWVAFFTSSGTPRDIIVKIADEAARMLHQPEVMKYNPGWGVDPVGNGPDAFAVIYRREIDRYTRLIREAKIPQVD